MLFQVIEYILLMILLQLQQHDHIMRLLVLEIIGVVLDIEFVCIMKICIYEIKHQNLIMMFFEVGQIGLLLK